MADRCPECDAPLATMADIREDDTPRPEDDLLCWRVFNLECRRPPIDWRARCLAAEELLADLAHDHDAADRAASAYQRQMFEAQDAYADSAEVLIDVAAERDRALDRSTRHLHAINRLRRALRTEWAKRVEVEVDLRAVLEEKAVAGEGEDAQSGTEGGE